MRFFSWIVVLLLGLSLARADEPGTNYAWTTKTVDPDALAARMTRNLDLYRATSKAALDAYAKAHPAAQPGDEAAKKAMQLETYLWFWNDAMGEGLWRIEMQLVKEAEAGGVQDPFFSYAAALGNPRGKVGLEQEADVFAATGYPDLFKCSYYRVALAEAEDADEAGQILSKWEVIFQKLVQSGLPTSTLYDVGTGPMDAVDGKGELAQKAYDEAESSLPPDSALAMELKGRYLTVEAWLSRGNDFANNVSDSQWAGFRDSLNQASQVLGEAYAKYPKEAKVSTLMLAVELGQGQGRDRMEQWFQRAIQADPQDMATYSSKFWYLQPRWYGSVDDLLEFGKECRTLPHGPPNVETAFFVAMSEAHDLDKDLYRQPETWAEVEKAYREYLDKYPQSVFYRTGFAEHALQAGHGEIAREQLALLGENWDRGLMTPAEYAAAMNSTANSPAGSPPATPTAGERLWDLVKLVSGFFGW